MSVNLQPARKSTAIGIILFFAAISLQMMSEFTNRNDHPIAVKYQIGTLSKGN